MKKSFTLQLLLLTKLKHSKNLFFKKLSKYINMYEKELYILTKIKHSESFILKKLLKYDNVVKRAQTFRKLLLPNLKEVLI